MRARDIINEADKITVRNIKAFLRDHPEAITHMHNPPDDLVLYALRQGSAADILDSMKDVSERVLLTILKDEPDLISYIRKPTEQMWLMAIKDDPSLIEEIPKQTPAIQMAAYQADPSVLTYIKKPSPELIKLAVEQGHSRYLAHAIELTDAKTQLDAIKANVKAANHIENMKPPALKWLLKKNKSEVIVGVISNIPVETIEACKDDVIKFILRCIKNPDDMGYPYEYPSMRSFLYAGKYSLIRWLEAKKISWPELGMIKSSLKAIKPRALGETDA